MKLGGLFAGQRLDTFQTVSRPDGVVRELPLPCAHAGSPAETAAFQLGPGVRVRLSVKEHLQAVVLPVHFHTAPVELPAGKLPLRLFGEGYQIIQELAVEPLQLDHADLADRMIQDGALSFSSIWNHINKYLPDEAYTLINARLSRIKKTQ